MKNYDIAINKMLQCQNIAIFTHANADGDAIGSAFAFYFFLKDKNKNVDVFCKTTIPSQLKFLNIEGFLNKKNRDHLILLGKSMLEDELDNVKVPYKIAPRRAGDIAACYSDPTKAKKELGFEAKRSLEDMCRDAWNFENK